MPWTAFLEVFRQGDVGNPGQGGRVGVLDPAPQGKDEEGEEKGETKDRRNDLVSRQDGTENSQRNIKAAGQGHGQRGHADLAPVDGWLRIGKELKRDRIQHEGKPEDQEKAEGAEEFGQDHVPTRAPARSGASQSSRA